MWQPGFWKTHPFAEGFGHSSGVVSAAVVSLAMSVEEFQKLAVQTVLLMAYHGLRCQQHCPGLHLSKDVKRAHYPHSKPTPMLRVEHLGIPDRVARLEVKQQAVVCGTEQWFCKHCGWRSGISALAVRRAQQISKRVTGRLKPSLAACKMSLLLFVLLARTRVCLHVTLAIACVLHRRLDGALFLGDGGRAVARWGVATWHGRCWAGWTWRTYIEGY